MAPPLQEIAAENSSAYSYQHMSSLTTPEDGRRTPMIQQQSLHGITQAQLVANRVKSMSKEDQEKSLPSWVEAFINVFVLADEDPQLDIWSDEDLNALARKYHRIHKKIKSRRCEHSGSSTEDHDRLSGSSSPPNSKRPSISDDSQILMLMKNNDDEFLLDSHQTFPVVMDKNEDDLLCLLVI